MRLERQLIGLLCGLFISASPAMGQLLPLSPDLEAAYPRGALPYEMAVQTTDGCGMFTWRPDDATVRYLPTIINTLTENWSRYRWQGLCYEGLALGPGVLELFDKDGKPLGRTEMWALRGRGIGDSTSYSHPPEDYKPSISRGYAWKGIGYGGNVEPVVKPVEAPAADGPSYNLFHTPNDRSGTINWSLYAASGSRPARLIHSTITDKYIKSGKYTDRLTEYPCPASGCGDLWIEKVGPLIREYADYRTHTLPEVDAIKVRLLPIVSPLIKKMEDDRREVEQKQHEALAAERLAKRAQAVSDANTNRRPMDTPNLKALLQRALGGKP